MPDLQSLLTDLPPEASTPARLIVRHVLMRVFGRFARALDGARDAASIQAFVVWSQRQRLRWLVPAFRESRSGDEPVGV